MSELWLSPILKLETFTDFEYRKLWPEIRVIRKYVIPVDHFDTARIAAYYELQYGASPAVMQPFVTDAEMKLKILNIGQQNKGFKNWDLKVYVYYAI